MNTPVTFIRVVLILAILLSVGGRYASRPVFAQEEEHVVQPGETLSEIAQDYGTDTETLRRLNNLGNVDVVWIGQRLVLPDTTPADTAPAAPAETMETTIYVVQPGDSLSTIAVAHRMSLAQLIELNRISPAQRLYTGQALTVPAVDNADASGARTDTASGERIHVVQRGEHLGAIAARYEVSAQAIARANSLGNGSLIRPGQQLVIPEPAFAEKATTALVETAGYHVHTMFPSSTEKWIDVDLSEQRVVAYEGAKAVNAFIISSGLPGTPTVKGAFHIWAKTPIQDMYGGNRAAGDDYYLEDVQWVQYFHQNYGFHGATWHNKFGQPMSRGCINMRNQDAQWLFDWASPEMTGKGWLFSDDTNPGTLVVVHE